MANSFDPGELFAAVLETAPDACVVFDRELRILFANRLARDYVQGAEMVGLLFHEFWPRGTTEAKLRKVLETGETERFETYDPRSQRWFHVTATRAMEGITLFSRDITAAKETETALSLSEGRYRETMEQSPLSVQILTLSGHTRWVNPAFTRLWGATLEDMKGFSLLEDPQLEELGLAEPLRRAFAGEVAVLPIRRYDASQVHPHMGIRVVRAMAYPVRDTWGDVQEVVLIHEDVTEVTEAEARMTHQSRQLRVAMEGIGAGRWEIDLATNALEWSPEMYALLNLPETVVPNLDRFIEMIHPADREAAERNLVQAIATLGKTNTEFRVRIPNRGERWLASVGRVVAGSDGKAERVVGINFDVTDRVQTRVALERTERSLALAMKGGRMGYWTRELATDEIRTEDRVEWSPELEEVFGLEPGTFQGTEGGFFAFVHPDDLAMVATTVREAVENRTDYTIQFRYRHASGEWRWMEGRGRATYGTGGQATRIDGIGIDITPQKRAEEARRAVEERFRRLANSVPAIVWSADANGRVEFLNDQWVQYTGIDLATYLSLGYNPIYHPDDRAAVIDCWLEARDAGTEFRVEVRYRRYDGVYRWFLASAVPTRDANGEVVGWFGTATDIHAQKTAEAELEARVLERTAELEAANRELEGFTYTVSHDLRTPLRAIMSTSMILLEESGEALGREGRELLTRQAHNARRLGLLIDDLLHIARIGRQEMVRTHVDLAELARDVVRELAEDQDAKEIRFEIPESLPVQGDPNLLRLLLLNLLENASKFSPAGGVVSLGKMADGTFFVRDQGIGFDPRYAHKLFLPFERLVEEADYPGTGIGLANVKRIVDRHGGKVWAESQLGAGATFYFALSD